VDDLGSQLRECISGCTTRWFADTGWSCWWHWRSCVSAWRHSSWWTGNHCFWWSLET